MLRLRKLGVVVTIVGVGLVGTAQALPEDPPKAHVRFRGERIQRAPLAAQCWPAANGGMGCSEETPLPWPTADEIPAGSRVKVRLKWSKKPTKIEVDSYRSIGNDGKPEGEEKDVFSRLIRVERNGETKAWDVRFRLRAPRRHYVKVYVRWRVGIGVYHAHIKAES